MLQPWRYCLRMKRSALEQLVASQVAEPQTSLCVTCP